MPYVLTQVIYKRFMLFLTFFSCVFIFSCGEGDVKDGEIVLGEDDSLYTITHPGFSMNVILSRTLLFEDSAHVEYNDMLGFLEVEIGESFRLELIDDSLDIGAIKDDLSNHPLFTYNTTDLGDNAFDYHAILPNGQEHSRHFVILKDLNGSFFTIRTAQNGQFNQNDLDIMRKAVDSMMPIQ